MKLRTAFFGAAMAAALTTSATAGQISGWYIGLEGGASWVEDWDHLFNGAARTAEFDTGWSAFATVGRAWGSGWRVEFEAGYRDNEFDRLLDNLGAPIANATGNLWEATAMANVLYSLTVTDKLSLSIGAGAGGDFANLDLFLTGLGKTEEDDWNFAYQGIAGVNYMIGRRTALFVNYRYFRTLEPDFRMVFPIGAAVRPIQGEDDFVKHSATIGLRVAFGQDEPTPPPYVAPPPPTPAGPSAPPKQFIVFFGYNKYSLTSEAQRVIGEAVASAKEGSTASILITGHTDTMGTPAYNQRLSMRRSNTVKAEMVRQGIPAGAITSTGRGETELLVQTADGVKEPQNRRATIDLN
jgi:outer membrane protein OmpA-like peptidoglycan-associated protein